MTGYAVVDVETTGITPAGRHRVVEIAVVHLDESGASTTEWSTLINPHRDLCAGHIHRIRARDVRKAPEFQHVAGELADLGTGQPTTWPSTPASSLPNTPV